MVPFLCSSVELENNEMAWCRHQMETFSSLLTQCEGNPHITGGKQVKNKITRHMHRTSFWALHWRHNDHDGVPNHQTHGCLLNRLFRRRSNKTSKLRVTGLCVGNSPVPVNSPQKGPVTWKMFPFDDVIIMVSAILRIFIRVTYGLFLSKVWLKKTIDWSFVFTCSVSWCVYWNIHLFLFLFQSTCTHSTWIPWQRLWIIISFHPLLQVINSVTKYRLRNSALWDWWDCSIRLPYIHCAKWATDFCCAIANVLLEKKLSCLRSPTLTQITWWSHWVEIFSALLALCEGNLPVTRGFPSQRPETRSFDVFFWPNGWANNRDAGDLRRHLTYIITSL